MALPAREVFSLNDKKIIELFLQAKHLQGFSELSINGYRLELNKFVQFLEQEVGKSMLEIKPAEVRMYLNQNPKLQPASIGRKIAILKSLYKFLVNEDYLEVNIMDKIESPKLGKSLPKFLTLEEIEKVREVINNKRDKAIIELFYSSGMRLSELQSLNRDDLDFEKLRVKVTGKGSKQRICRFSERAKKCILDYLNTRKDENPALFISQRGDRMSKRAIQHRMKEIGEKAGLKRKLHPHVWRHSFASQAVQNGVKIQAVQEMCGHSSLQTTTIYSRLTDKHLDEEYDKIPT